MTLEDPNLQNASEEVEFHAPSQGEEAELTEEQEIETEDSEQEYEGEDDLDEGEPEETEPEEGEDPEPEPTYELKIDGEIRKYTSQQLVEQAQLGIATQKRFDEAASSKKQVLVELNAAQTVRSQYAAALKQAETELEGAFADVDWAKLSREDPAAWTAHKQAYEDRKVEIEQAKALEQQQYNQLMQQMGAKLPEVIPEWADEQVASEEKPKLRQTALNLGFAAEEVDAVFDPRMVALLRKAYLYDAGQTKQAEAKASLSKKKVTKPKTLLKPGAHTGARKAASKTVADLKAKAIASGDPDDFANYRVAKMQAEARP